MSFFFNISHVCFGYCSLVLVRGCFQASLLGISVMTGSVRLYLPFNWHYPAIVTKAPGRKRKPIILQSSFICYCGKMLVPGEVFRGSGLILFVIANFMSLEFDILTSLCALVHRFLHRCLRDLISRGFLVPYFFRIEHAAKIVNCVNFIIFFALLWHIH